MIVNNPFIVILGLFIIVFTIMENEVTIMGKSSIINGQCSIAVLDYRMVFNYLCHKVKFYSLGLIQRVLANPMILYSVLTNISLIVL